MVLFSVSQDKYGDGLTVSISDWFSPTITSESNASEPWTDEQFVGFAGGDGGSFGEETVLVGVTMAQNDDSDSSLSTSVIETIVAVMCIVALVLVVVVLLVRRRCRRRRDETGTGYRYRLFQAGGSPPVSRIAIRSAVARSDTPSYVRFMGATTPPAMQDLHCDGRDNRPDYGGVCPVLDSAELFAAFSSHDANGTCQSNWTYSKSGSTSNSDGGSSASSGMCTPRARFGNPRHNLPSSAPTPILPQVVSSQNTPINTHRNTTSELPSSTSVDGERPAFFFRDRNSQRAATAAIGESTRQAIATLRSVSIDFYDLIQVDHSQSPIVCELYFNNAIVTFKPTNHIATFQSYQVHAGRLLDPTVLPAVDQLDVLSTPIAFAVVANHPPSEGGQFKLEQVLMCDVRPLMNGDSHTAVVLLHRGVDQRASWTATRLEEGDLRHDNDVGRWFHVLSSADFGSYLIAGIPSHWITSYPVSIPIRSLPGAWQSMLPSNGAGASGSAAGGTAAGAGAGGAHGGGISTASGAHAAGGLDHAPHQPNTAVDVTANTDTSRRMSKKCFNVLIFASDRPLKEFHPPHTWSMNVYAVLKQDAASKHVITLQERAHSFILHGETPSRSELSNDEKVNLYFKVLSGVSSLYKFDGGGPHQYALDDIESEVCRECTTVVPLEFLRDEHSCLHHDLAFTSSIEKTSPGQPLPTQFGSRQVFVRYKMQHGESSAPPSRAPPPPPTTATTRLIEPEEETSQPHVSRPASTMASATNSLQGNLLESMSVTSSEASLVLPRSQTSLSCSGTQRTLISQQPVQDAAAHSMAVVHQSSMPFGVGVELDSPPSGLSSASLMSPNTAPTSGFGSREDVLPPDFMSR